MSVDELYDHFNSIFGEANAKNVQSENSENIFSQNMSAEEVDIDFTESEIRDLLTKT